MGLRFVTFALLLLSCSDSDGGQNGDGTTNGGGTRNQASAPAPTRKLMLSTTVARLQFGARLQIVGHLLDKQGDAVNAALVSFALVGHAEDSSLDVLDANTDARGSFANALNTGVRAATFRVRASSKGASDAFLDVVVTDAGFGSLRVTADYDGARAVVQRSVFARAGSTCLDDAARGEGDPMAAFSAKKSAVLLPALPAGTDYAVRVVGRSALGGVVAQGCMDHVRVATDAETAITVAFKDEPLMRSGDFTLQAELDASGPASVLRVKLSTAATALIEGDVLGDAPPVDADAFFLLNQIDELLRNGTDAEPGWHALADALAVERDAVADEVDGGVGNNTADHELQAMLGVEGKGPRLAIEALAQRTQEDLSQMRLMSVVVLVPAGGQPAKWQLQRIEALPTIEDAPPMLIDLTLVKTGTTSSAEFVPERDVLDVSRLTFRAKFGALATQVLRGVLRSRIDGGQFEDLRDALGCPVLAEWMQARSYAGACKTTCVEAACDRALGALQRAAEEALSAVDVARPTVTFSGDFLLSDRDSDLIAETMECDDFEGEWAAGSKGTPDVITGKASAVAVLLAP